MRLWTLHPRYLDPQGLVALWREALLAQKVIRGMTSGYRSHPQLSRFVAQPDPLACISSYLEGVYQEAVRRGYNFNRSKIHSHRAGTEITENEGQLLYEWSLLKRKLKARNPGFFAQAKKIECPEPHPLFRIVAGPIADWERIK